MTGTDAPAAEAARTAFTRGLLASGVSVNGLMASHNEQVAAKMFRTATEADPSMCDGWLARIIAGDDAVAVLAGAWQSRQAMGWETRRLGVLPGQFTPLVFDGLFARMEITSEASLGACYAVALARDGRYREADELLEQVTATDPFDADLQVYARGVLHFRAQRWPDVLADFPGGRRWRKPIYGAAAAAMATTALASLGVFEDAFRRAKDAIEGDLCPQAATIALYTQAHVFAASGQGRRRRAAAAAGVFARREVQSGPAGSRRSDADAGGDHTGGDRGPHRSVGCEDGAVGQGSRSC